MTDSSPPAASESLVALAHALIDAGATLSQVVAHMSAHRPAGHRRLPDGLVEPVTDVLAPLLTDTLAPVALHHGPQATATAAAFLQDVADTLADDLFLVPVEPPPAGRRSRGKLH